MSLSQLFQWFRGTAEKQHPQKEPTPLDKAISKFNNAIDKGHKIQRETSVSSLLLNESSKQVCDYLRCPRRRRDD